ncbi:hypothetical protein PISMIDRAFT_144375 [Pisolithus microcarpus 441]|uniref:Uncharacterized protein n=1 Tax=Pisolithus microcarpus 441 TaxID=765257 RepID=A0A0D0A735_9AGAM|nr:hypothetical protein PISMIDRAFT_144375 [Pisolithus microcarpus 441]
MPRSPPRAESSTSLVDDTVSTGSIILYRISVTDYLLIWQRTHRPLSVYIRRSGSKNLVSSNHEFAASEIIHLTHSEWRVRPWGCLTSPQKPCSIILSCARESRRKSMPTPFPFHLALPSGNREPDLCHGAFLLVLKLVILS